MHTYVHMCDATDISRPSNSSFLPREDGEGGLRAGKQNRQRWWSQCLWCALHCLSKGWVPRHDGPTHVM